MKRNSALDVQVGGAHYKNVKIQPVEFAEQNSLSFCEANILKYLCRWRSKNGLQDIEKAEHYLQLLLQLSKRRSCPFPIRWDYALEKKAKAFLKQWGFTGVEMEVARAVIFWRRNRDTFGVKDRRALTKALERFPAIREVYLTWNESKAAGMNSCGVG